MQNRLIKTNLAYLIFQEGKIELIYFLRNYYIRGKYFLSRLRKQKKKHFLRIYEIVSEEKKLVFGKSLWFYFWTVGA